jgi:LysR family transcriptional regulator, transcriptional activator for dmlA
MHPRRARRLAASARCRKGGNCGACCASTPRNLATNDGEIAVQWALAGLGILMRAEWDVARYLQSGRLMPVLPQWRTPDADIHAVWPQRHQHSARVRAFVEFLAAAFSAP